MKQPGESLEGVLYNSIHSKDKGESMVLRVGDERLLRLITRMLKAGIMEDGLVKVSEDGAPRSEVPVTFGNVHSYQEKF